MPHLTIFLDDGGVMNDNRLRGEQWHRLVGEFFMPVLGGSADAWAEANRVVAPRLWERFLRSEYASTEADFRAWLHGDRLAWLREMADLAGVSAPAVDDEVVDLVCRAESYITRRVRAALPGVPGAIRALHTLGYTLHTASGEISNELDGYLDGMGVRDCFAGLYGPDLINTAKQGTAYYTRVFAHAGVSPDRALVVDDNPLPIAWAAAAGARTVLIGQAVTGEIRPDLTLKSLAELPPALAALDLP
jgi:HAD superfamily hydrolase (TIGR01509 family)